MSLDKTYRVNETFYSIQGEGLHGGRSVVFVRFAGCNLACPFCDTKHESFDAMKVLKIADKIREARDGAFLDYMIDVPIVLTGGEPMLQLDSKLVDYLSRMNEVHVETNGTIWNEGVLEHVTHLTVSPKTPIEKIAIVKGPSDHAYPEGPEDAQERITKMLVDTGTESELKIVWADHTLNMQLFCDWGYNIPWTRKSIQPCYHPDGSVFDKEGLLQFILRNPEWRLSTQVQKHLNFQ
jgi:organic radical activating enzyme